MCSRYSVTSPPEAVRAYFRYRETPNFPARYNIAPTQPIAVVCRGKEGRAFKLMRWGLLPSWVKDPNFQTLINARAETALVKPAFRAAMRYRRCLIPTDGFYEWTGPKGSRRPFLVRPKGGGLLALAGLWETWRDPQGEVDTAVILTTVSNAAVGVLHDRMPAVLAPEHFDAWLDCETVSAETAHQLLQPAEEDLLELIEVHPKLNDSRRDEPGLQEPVQGTLV
jgi:putative SOS response-associated peptidase YedK